MSYYFFKRFHLAFYQKHVKTHSVLIFLGQAQGHVPSHVLVLVFFKTQAHSLINFIKINV